MASVWDELRPRFLYINLRTPRLAFRWAIPHVAAEEIVALVLKLAPLALWIVTSRRRDASPDMWAVLPGFTAAFVAHDGRGILRIPSGQIFVSVRTHDFELVIGQL